MMPYFKAVLVDIDGTVVNCEERNRRVLERVARDNGGEIKKQDWAFLAGTGDDIIWNWLKKNFEDFRMEKEDFLLAAKQGYLTDQFGVSARAGMVDAFNHVLDRRLKLAAVTNSPAEIATSNLRMAAVDHYLPIRVTRTDVDARGLKPKPAADAFLLAAQILEVTPDQCLVIGDTPNDVLGARAASMTVIQYVGDMDQRHDDAHYHAYDGRELMDYIKHLVI
jgi:HAD superfamily hydrolase (TIGR01509 family)